MEEQYIDVQGAERQFGRSLELLQSDPAISDRNRELILRYVRDARLGKTVRGRAKKRIGVARLTANIAHLRVLMRAVEKPLDMLTEADMESFVEALDAGRILSRQPLVKGRNAVTVRQRPLSPGYRVDVKNTVRKFYKWLLGESRYYPKLVDWIDTSREDKEVPALTRSEVQRMIDCSTTVLQRAVIQVLFDGGFRIGELLNIRLRHVTRRAYDARDPSVRCFFIRVPFSKTLRRTVALPMAESTKWLSFWLERHPAKPSITQEGVVEAIDVEAPLFPVRVTTISDILRRAGRRALGKRVYPHLMRHTSATYWCRLLPHYRFCARLGWAMTSRMPQRYIDREGIDEMETAVIYRDEMHAQLQRNRDVVVAQHLAIVSEEKLDGDGVEAARLGEEGFGDSRADALRARDSNEHRQLAPSATEGRSRGSTSSHHSRTRFNGEGAYR